MFLELQSSVLKTFADAINNSKDSSKDSVTFYAKVVQIDGTDIYVRLYGADKTTQTPATTTVEVGLNDIVMVRMKNHTVTIVGNISYPALTRVGPIYITLTDQGLVVGQLSKDNVPTGNHILITPDDVKLLTVGGAVLASFGETVQLGKTANLHTTLDSDGLKIYNATTLIASFGETVQIGATNKPHVVITASNMVFYNAAGNEMFRAGSSTSGWGSVNGIETQGSVIATNGVAKIHNHGENAVGEVTAGSGVIIAVGNEMHSSYNASLMAGKNWQGVTSDNCRNIWLIWNNANNDQAYLFSHVDGQTVYTTPVKNLLRGGYSTLWSGEMNAIAESTDWNMQTVTSLMNWDLVLVRVRCGSVYTGVVISRGNNNATFTVKDYDYTYSGTSYNLQTNVKVNFNELYIAVARGAGPSAAAAVELFRITSVVGLIRSITNY